MPTTQTDSAVLAWSHSRDQMLSACARRYFHRYYGSYNGWRRDAAEPNRRAYRLTQLTTLDLALGTAIHTRARELASAIVAKTPRPSYEDLVARTRAELNRLWRNGRSLGAFMRDPRAHPMLLDVYYERDVSPRQIERVRARMITCNRHLSGCALWDVLECCDTARVHVIDSPVAFVVDQVTVWAAPDLVYTPPGGRPVIIDWKTGRVDPRVALDQLRVYGLCVSEAFGIPVGADGYEGRIVELSSGECWSIDLLDDDLDAARGLVLASAAKSRELLVAPDYRDPRPVEAFPLAADRATCTRCNYWELCAAELEACHGR